MIFIKCKQKSGNCTEYYFCNHCCWESDGWCWYDKDDEDTTARCGNGSSGFYLDSAWIEVEEVRKV